MKNTGGKTRFFGSEDSFEVGYQLNRNNQFTFVQNLQTIQSSDRPNEGVGTRAQIQHGDVHAIFNDILGNADRGVSFSYDGFVRLPVGSVLREQGYYGEIRNVLKLKHNYAAHHSISLKEVPIFQAYNGNIYRSWNKTQHVSKNTVPAFENRLYLQFEGEITKELTYSIPIFWGAGKERSISGGAGLRWIHFINIWPELNYAVTPKFTVGVAYRSGDLKINRGPVEDFTDGFINTGGVFQGILKATL